MSDELAPEEALRGLSEGGLRGPVDEAWRLFDRAWPALVQRLGVFLSSLGVAREIREDCGQAALLRVWRSRTDYRGTETGELLGWIWRTCQREHVRLLEQHGRGPRAESELGVDGEESVTELDELEGLRRGDTTGAALERRDRRRALDECVAALEDRLRQVTELLYAADACTERQVAEVLGISKSRVHELRQEALRALERCLERKGEA